MDFTIRTAKIEDATGIARVHVDVWRETYSGIVPSSYLDQLNYETRGQRWRNILSDSTPDNTNFVATDLTGSIIGFISMGPGRDPGFDKFGEIFAIYIYQRCQGLGLGRRLMQESFNFLRASGFNEFYLWVLKANPALSFYLRVRAKENGEKIIDIGGAPLQEIRMLWKSGEK
jgi:ribosomal protein S18 acetylase RimI-like enzyme